MGLLVYNKGYPTQHIPTGVISVVISGVFRGIAANLTGLHC